MTTCKQANLEDLRPYGDTLDDGRIQLSFALPVPACPESAEAAKQLVLKLGLADPLLVCMEAMGESSSFFVLYAAMTRGVDYAQIVAPTADFVRLERGEIDDFVALRIGRPLVVVGACPGSDAHTVGIDAIMNMKGYAGHHGLERYRMFRALNLGAQVPPETFVARALAENADAVLASVIVTQKELHLTTLTRLIALLEAEGVRSRIMAIAGGPRMTHDLATELGFDAGFGAGTFAEDVAAFIAQEWVRRHGSR